MDSVVRVEEENLKEVTRIQDSSNIRIDEFNQIIEKLKEENSQLRNDRLSDKESVQRLQKENKDFLSEISEKNKIIENLNIEIQAFKRDLQGSNASIEKERQELILKVKEGDSVIDQCVKNLKISDQSIQKKDSKIQELENRFEIDSQTIQQLTATVEHINTQFNQQIDITKKLESKMEGIRSDKDTEIKNLIGHLQNQQKTLEGLELEKREKIKECKEVQVQTNISLPLESDQDRRYTLNRGLEEHKNKSFHLFHQLNEIMKEVESKKGGGPRSVQNYSMIALSIIEEYASDIQSQECLKIDHDKLWDLGLGEISTFIMLKEDSRVQKVSSLHKVLQKMIPKYIQSQKQSAEMEKQIEYLTFKAKSTQRLINYSINQRGCGVSQELCRYMVKKRVVSRMQNLWKKKRVSVYQKRRSNLGENHYRLFQAGIGKMMMVNLMERCGNVFSRIKEELKPDNIETENIRRKTAFLQRLTQRGQIDN